MPYVHELPASIAFRGKGLFGYSFGPLLNKDLEVLYIESETGHDTFMICKGVTRIYYVLAGSGSFTIEGRTHGVRAGMLVEAPAGVEYSYSGRMTMLAFCKRRWPNRKDKFTRWNRDVVGEDAPWQLAGDSWLTRFVRMRVFGKSPTNAFLRLNQGFWKTLSPSLVRLRPLEWYGRFLHGLARIQGVRAQAPNTFFLRNRPQLDLIQRLVKRKKPGDTVRVAVLGCSTGAEVYSIAWAIRTARPDLRLVVHAVDVSTEAVEFARRGIYPRNAKLALNHIRDCMAAGRWRVGEPGSDLVGSEIFERMTEREMAEFFDLHEDAAVVKDWLREGINWGIGDVREAEILEKMGLHDIVVASNFLCHMGHSEAERCLRNIATLVVSQGFLFVSGIDLDIRQKVACDLGWELVADLLEEIHDGDSCLRRQWPFEYAGLEPLNKRRRDWKTRYAAAFQVVSPATNGQRLHYDGTTSLEELKPQNTKA
jgi:chemotaxis methyl-accepting protein methylase